MAAEGAILNEMLEIVAKRAALRPTASQVDLTAAGAASTSMDAGITLADQSHDHEESNVGVKREKSKRNNLVINEYPLLSDLNNKIALGFDGLRSLARIFTPKYLSIMYQKATT